MLRGGLIEFDLRTRKAESHLYSPAEAGSPFENWVRAVAVDDNQRIWASTATRGVQVRGRHDAEFRPLPLPETTAGSARFESGGPLLPDEAGILWAGFDGSGLLKVNTHESPFRHVLPLPLPGRRTGAGFVKPLLEARDGRILAGTYDHGLAAIDPFSGATTWFTRDPRNAASLSSNGVVSLAEDPGGTLWVGTLGGLNQLQPDGRSFRRILPAPGSDAGINDAIITALLPTATGRVWVGTRGAVTYNRILANIRGLWSRTEAEGFGLRLGMFAAVLSSCLESVIEMQVVRAESRISPGHYLAVLLTGLALFAILSRRYSRAGIAVAALCLVPFVVDQWPTYANHQWLALWTIPVAALFPQWWKNQTYARYIRLTLGLVMIAAGMQKIVAGTYLDGTFIAFMSHYGDTTERMFSGLCDARTRNLLVFNFCRTFNRIFPAVLSAVDPKNWTVC